MYNTPNAIASNQNLPTLVEAMQPIQFYSCFISHSHKDEEFCRRLHSRMRDEGLRVWFAPEHIKGGRTILEQIDRAIRVHDKLLLVLSENSMASDSVATEIRRARKKEAERKGRVLFPIRLVGMEAIRKWERFDADSGKDIAAEVREYFIPDFSHWKDHDAFEAGFARLLRDLKADSETEPGGESSAANGRN
ncbi:MAG: toll/interleukin-1 receptor domain-containing protein [Candidatus Sumerlaeota bacterium]|nr:toll/interleukin-1 receptor domain-containing protein [Candidatus Sumerlaeota bacterium]